MSDNFDDGLFPDYFDMAGCNPVAEAGGQLVLDRTGCAAGGGLSVLMKSSQIICGDFDAQVDFQLNQFTTPSNGWRFANFNVQSVDGTLLGVAERYARAQPSDPCTPYDQSYKMWFNDPASCNPATAFFPTADTQGKFRIARVGSTLSVYYWSGTSWVLGKSTSFAGDVRLGMYMGGVDGQAFQIRYDNLLITSPNSVPITSSGGFLALIVALSTLGAAMLRVSNSASGA